MLLSHLKEVAPEVSKKPSIGKGDSTIISIQKTLNSRYGCNLVVDGITGPKTKSALIKALQTELNRQFNKKLVVDGKWGAKTKAAIVTIKKVQKATLLGFCRLRFTPKDITLDHWIPSLEKVLKQH